jgi:hypothetical protein
VNIRPLLDALFVLGLALWIAAIVSAAVSAMNVFPGLDPMPITHADYAAWPLAEHGRLAASLVMERVFFTVDLLQFMAIPLVVVTGIARLALSPELRRRRRAWMAAVAIFLATAGFAAYAASIAPPMNRALRQFWTEAAAGNLDAAREHRERFDEGHRIADPLLRLNLVLLLIGLGLTAATPTPARPPRARQLDSLLPETP